MVSGIHAFNATRQEVWTTADTYTRFAWNPDLPFQQVHRTIRSLYRLRVESLPKDSVVQTPITRRR